MSLRLRLLERLPFAFRPAVVRLLAAATARGFACPPFRPPLHLGVSFDHAALESYARFTSAHADALLVTGDRAALRATTRRLRREAAALGDTARRALGISGPGEALRGFSALYACIGIKARSDGCGGLVVNRCLFARHFSEPVCRVAEALDQGVAAGLHPGFDLRFHQRITAGNPCCLAHLRGGRTDAGSNGAGSDGPGSDGA